MIKSRRAVTKDDGRKCCGSCRFLRTDQEGFKHCGIDGEIPKAAGLLTMMICRHYKEVKTHGSV